MRTTATRILIGVALASLLGCSSSPQGDGSSRVEVLFVGSEPRQTFEEVGPLTTRHWSIEQGLRQLQADSRKLGADAIIRVDWEEYVPASGEGVDSTRSRRRVNEGYSQVVFEIEGLAVKWAEPD